MTTYDPTLSRMNGHPIAWHIRIDRHGPPVMFGPFRTRNDALDWGTLNLTASHSIHPMYLPLQLPSPLPHTVWD